MGLGEVWKGAESKFGSKCVRIGALEKKNYVNWVIILFLIKPPILACFITFSMGGLKKWVSTYRYSDKRYKIC